MATPYGTIVCHIAKNTVVTSYPELASILNNCMKYDEGEWECWDDEDGIVFSECCIMNMCGINFEKLYVVLEDGEFIPYSDATEEQIDDYDFVTEPMSIEEVSNLIAPLIKSGWIEFASVVNEKSRFVRYDTYRIYADGTIEVKCQGRGLWCSDDDVEDSETYKPTPILPVS